MILWSMVIILSDLQKITVWLITILISDLKEKMLWFNYLHGFKLDSNYVLVLMTSNEFGIMFQASKHQQDTLG